MSAWLEKLYETFIASGGYRYILEGFKNTIVITMGALVIGVLIGAAIAITKYFADESKALKPLAIVCDVYTTVIRGVPITVLLLIFYLVILVSASDLMVAIVAFGINSGAYMAELIRSGINAVDKGQMEAGRSLGMSRGQTMFKIILPQAVRYILPAIGNEFISILKETSVIGFLGVMDLTRFAEKVITRTADVYYPYISVALIYLVMVMFLTSLVTKLERRLAKNDKR